MIEVLSVAGAVALLLYIVPLLCYHPYSRWWLAQWHGEGAEHQQMVYRCHACRDLVTWRRIRKGGCPCGTSGKISPAVLGLVEKARLLFMPWSVR